MSIPKAEKTDRGGELPAAAPSPEKTATSIRSAGTASATSTNALSVASKRKGVDSLRVGLNVTSPRNGLSVP